MNTPPGLDARITDIVRNDRGRLLAALIARLNSFELAEDALSDALESAVTHWQRSGIPDNPNGWLLRVARRKAIDKIRRDKRFRDRQGELERLAAEDEMDSNRPAPDIPDERLALIFTCCHPALDPKSRIALTLRTVGGLTTTEIARAFLDKDATMGQRLSRARAKISVSGIPFAVPGPELWDERLASVLSVIYLIFNEGYAASSGDFPVRRELCDEAFYLARLLDRLCPREPEIMGFLSLMLTTQARAPARNSNITIPLSRQDRSLWDQELIKRGISLLDDAMAAGAAGPYQIKAAISALHVQAVEFDDTDWQQIVLLYDSLNQYEPSAVVHLNRAVAIAEAGRLQEALGILESLAHELTGYQPYFAACAEYLAKTGEINKSVEAYSKAIDLTGNSADREFLKMQKKKLEH